MTFIRNILWEVDDVLFDTHPAVTYAVSKTLKELGLSVALNEIDGLTRQSVDHCLATLCRRFKLKPALLQLQFDKSCLEIPLERQLPFPGARDVCAFIQRRGMNIIVTHRSTDFTNQLLTLHDLGKYFAGSLSAFEGYPHKPDPTMFSITLQKFELSKKDTLVVGSCEGDIEAGKAAGLNTCLLKGTHILQPADHHFDDFIQLLAWLRTQR